MNDHVTFFVPARRYAAGVLVLALTACGSQGPQMPPRGPQDVEVVTLATQRVVLTTELPGRTSPYRVAEIRPQVNGVIQKRMFVEGGDVKEGDQLYQIDPAPYQAAFDSAQATLEHAQAAVLSAKSLVDRDKPLVESHAVSKQDYDNAYSTQMQADADVSSGKAMVETAQVNLTYTKMLAPISGRTGRSVTEGALVTANQTNTLVTVQQLDPIYVDIPQSTALLLRLRRELAAGQIKSAGADQAEVRLTLEDGSKFDQEGKLQFSETTVDPTTGSIILRAVFPNPKHLLLPGMFVNAELEEGVNENGLLVPQQAVTHDAQGHATALVVTSENKVEMRNLKTDRAIGDKWLVIEGVSAGDRVIVEGVQKVQPGDEVHPVETPTDVGAPAPQS